MCTWCSGCPFFCLSRLSCLATLEFTEKGFWSIEALWINMGDKFSKEAVFVFLVLCETTVICSSDHEERENRRYHIGTEFFFL